MPSPFALKRHPSGEVDWSRPALKGLAWASLMLLLGLAAATLQAAPAATYIVNDPADLPGVAPLTDGHCAAFNGKCTLRAAVMEANHTPGSATIILPTGTYSLTIPAAGPDDETTGDLNISTTVSIQGAGAASTIIDANGGTTLDRAFSVGAGAVVSLSGVTIRGGAPSGNGGGIDNAGVLSLDHSAVISNTAGGNGGGLNTVGQALTVTHSLISGNYATGLTGFGGGISGGSGSVMIVSSSLLGNRAAQNGGGLTNSVGATLAVYSSTIAGNTGFTGGGYVANFGSTTLVVATTLSGNSASAGGGLAQNGGTSNLVNSTISGNSANVDGGGIWNSCPCASEVNLYNVTVTNNQADADFNGSGDGGGVFNYNNGVSTVQPQDSLIAGNWATLQLIHGVFILRANDCHGPLTSLDYNLIGTTSDCTFTASPEDQLNVAPGIGALQNNGGPTWTHALLPGSLAIDAGAPSGCRDQNGTLLATDQRGYPRTANGAGVTRCDIGAFELQRIVDLPLVRR